MLHAMNMMKRLMKTIMFTCLNQRLDPEDGQYCQSANTFQKILLITFHAKFLFLDWWRTHYV